MSAPAAPYINRINPLFTHQATIFSIAPPATHHLPKYAPKMGNGISNAEFERQGKLLGMKSVPGQPGTKFKPLSLKQMKHIQKQIVFEYPFLTNVFESILVTDNELPDCPIGTRCQALVPSA